jgi:membrane protease YdiL (CAAX protease family)
VFVVEGQLTPDTPDTSAPAPWGRTPIIRPLAWQLVLVALSVVVFAVFHADPRGALLAGLPLPLQGVVGTGIATILTATFVDSLRVDPTWDDLRGAAGQLGFDLSGARLWLFAIVTAIAEELLFRGALQPLLGIWITAFVFALLHVGTYRLRPDLATARMYAFLFTAGLMLGAIADRAGLLAAMYAHAAWNAIVLLRLRRWQAWLENPPP